MKSYALPLSPDYVHSWGPVEAIREIIQNALDSESPFKYEFRDEPFGGKTLVINSEHTNLKPETLLLGTSSKRAGGKIGSFGEGFKLALLVLTRENIDVNLINGDVVWKPAFRHHTQFNADVLFIDEDKYVAGPQGRYQGLTFEVFGLSYELIEQVRDMCLKMQPEVGEVIKTNYGEILLEKPGKLYVGSLFICKTDMKYGYNVKPEHITLERDRQTVSSFELSWMARSMWVDTEQYDRIAVMLEEGYPDVKAMEFGAPEVVKEACYRHFVSKHPGRVIARNQEELDQKIKQGLTVYVSSSPAYYNCVSESRPYSRAAVKSIEVALPVDFLTKWLSENRKNMRSGAIESYKKEVLEAAKSWKHI